MWLSGRVNFPNTPIKYNGSKSSPQLHCKRLISYNYDKYCLIDSLCYYIDYEPAKRSYHSTVIVGDCLYMWGGKRGDHPREHNIETERRDSSFVEVLHLPTGRWEQKPTTGDPPLGIIQYAAVAIGNEIFYYRGHCSHHHYDDVLYSLNVDTFKWRKVVPTNSKDGPKEKDDYGMIAVKIEGEDYLVIIQPISINIHYFRIATGNLIVLLID